MRSNEFDPYIESLSLTIKTRKEVALEYGTTAKTLVRRLLKEGIVLPAGDLFPDSIKTIYYALGIPAAIKGKSKIE